MARWSMAALFTVVLGWVSCALAATEAAEPEHVEEKVNAFAGDWPLTVLTLVVFVVLLVILRKWAWEPLLAGLRTREEHIRDSIERAEEAQAQGEKALEDYKQQIANAQAEAGEIVKEGRGEAQRLAEQMKAQAKEDAAGLRDQAQRDIVRARDEALGQIYDRTAELATEMAGKIIHKELSADDHRGLLKEALGKLQGEDRV